MKNAVTVRMGVCLEGILAVRAEQYDVKQLD